MIRQRRLWA